MKYFFLFPILWLCASCIKSPLTEKQQQKKACDAVKNIKVYPVLPLTEGDTLVLKATKEDGVDYEWMKYYSPWCKQEICTNTRAQPHDRGWYYLAVSAPNCDNYKTDSVYVDVKLKQGTAFCTVTNNTITYDNRFPDVNLSTYKNINDWKSSLEIKGGNMIITFPAYWATHELEDGIYKTVKSTSDFEYFINKAHVYILKAGAIINIEFFANIDQSIYVSHVNGKIRVQFCNLVMTGSEDYVIKTTKASTTVTVQ